MFIWQVPVMLEVFYLPEYTNFPFDNVDIDIKLLWYDGQPGTYGSGVDFDNVYILFLEQLDPGNLFLPPSEVWTYQNETIEGRMSWNQYSFNGEIVINIKFPLVRKVSY